MEMRYFPLLVVRPKNQVLPVCGRFPQLSLSAVVLAVALAVNPATVSAISFRTLPDAPLPSSKAPSPAQQQLNRGIEALQQGDLAAAASAFTESAKTDPKSYLPHLGLAEVSLRSNKPLDAEKQVQQALKLAPGNPEVLTAGGRVAFANRQMALAERRLKQAVAADPKFFPARVDLGDLYLDTLRKPKLSAENFRAAVKINGEHAGAHYGLGRALAQSGDYAAALNEFAVASRLAPDNLLPRQATGELQRAQRQYQSALATFDDILKRKPDFIPALAGKAETYAAMGETDQAIASFEKLVATEPKHVESHLRLGMLYQGKQRWQEARAAYLAATKLDPNLAVAYNNLAWMTAELGQDLNEGLRWGKRAVEIAPKQPEFRDTLAWVYRARKELGLALSTLQEAVKMKPAVGAIQAHLGMVYEESNQPRQALAAYQQAVKLGPNSPEIEHAKQRIKALTSSGAAAR